MNSAIVGDCTGAATAATCIHTQAGTPRSGLRGCTKCMHRHTPPPRAPCTCDPWGRSWFRVVEMTNLAGAAGRLPQAPHPKEGDEPFRRPVVRSTRCFSGPAGRRRAPAAGKRPLGRRKQRQAGGGSCARAQPQARSSLRLPNGGMLVDPPPPHGRNALSEYRPSLCLRPLQVCISQDSPGTSSSFQQVPRKTLASHPCQTPARQRLSCQLRACTL